MTSSDFCLLVAERAEENELHEFFLSASLAFIFCGFSSLHRSTKKLPKLSKY